jgi:hypothetical protein
MRTIPIRDASDDEPEVTPRPPSFFLRGLMWVLWPAFLVAGVAEMFFFTLFDPHELHFFGDTIELSRTAIYTIGFFCFWAILAVSSAITLFLARGSLNDDIDE